MSYHVYVTVSGEDRIVRFSMDTRSGSMEPMDPIWVSGRPGPIALDPKRRFLYVGRRGSRQISSFWIDPVTGALNRRGTVPVPSDPCYIATDRSGRYLLSAYYLAGKAAVHAIDGDGYVIDPPLEWRDTGRGAHCFQTDPSNRFAFVPHIADEEGRNAIFQFRFDATTGRLSPNGPALVEQDPGVGPRHFCFHPSKDILYFSNEQECSVSAYGFDPSRGSLSHLQTASALPAVWSGANTCAQIQISPYGRFLYTPIRGHDSIATFAVDAGSGRLNLVGHTLTERMPRAFTLDPDGRFLLSAGEKSGRLAVFRIDGDTGRLDRIGVHMVGRTPLWVTVI